MTDAPTPPSNTALHDLLTKVASGELDPAEAARRLDEDPTAPTLDRLTVRSHQGVAGIRVEAVGVNLQVIADPTVTTAVADGPHRVHQEDDTLVFDLPGQRRGEDRYEATPSWQWGRFRLDWPYGSGERVTLRVNPDLAVTLELQACKVTVRGLHAALDLRSMNCSVGILGHHGPLTAAITTGSAQIEAVLTGPSDSVTTDMGSVKLTLLPGSDTLITSHAEMGSLKVAGPSVRNGHDDLSGLHSTSTAAAGAGTGRLEVSVRMGSAKVTIL